MRSYQAPYVSSNYSRERHMGRYYELGFRDLYPAPPMCDCQHTEKIGIPGSRGYTENFVFECGEHLNHRYVPIANTIGMASTSDNGVYAQTILNSSYASSVLPGRLDVEFHTAVVAFKEAHDRGQYEWVVEFTCGTNSTVFSRMFGDDFAGLNLYSRSGPLSATNLEEMRAAVEALGLSWALQPGGLGTGFNVVPHTSQCQYWNRSHAVRRSEAASSAVPNGTLCMMEHCLLPLVACEAEQTMCAKALACTQACAARNNTLPCLYVCLNSYEDDKYAAFIKCAVTDHKCLVRPSSHAAEPQRAAHAIASNVSAVPRPMCRRLRRWRTKFDRALRQTCSPAPPRST